MRPIRVLHVAPHLAQGGAERLLYDLATSQDDRVSHRVILMDDDVFFDRGRLDVTSLGFDLSQRSSSALKLLPAIRKLARYVAEDPPDVVQGWLYYGALLTLGLRSYPVPIVWSIHNTSLPPFRHNPVLHIVDRILARASWSRPPRIAYCAETAKRLHEMRGYNNQAGLVIDNGINTADFRPDPARRARLRQRFGLSEGTFAIGLFGRRDPQKDIPGCLDAFAEASAKHPEMRLVMAGRGMETTNPELAGWISRRGLTGRCRLLASVTDMGGLVNAVDAVMLGSRYGEAMPLVLLEALASGVPVVATQVGDVGRLSLPDQAMVQPNDHIALAAALSFLRQSAGGPLWDDAFRRTREHYSIERFNANFMELYSELAAGARHREAAS